MGANTRIRIVRGQMVDELPVDLGRGHLRCSRVGSEVLVIPEAFHESVEHICRRRNLRDVVGEWVAEAEPRKGRDHQVKWLMVGCIIRLGKQVDEVREGEVREGKRGYQQKWQGIALRGRNMNEVESQRSL